MYVEGSGTRTSDRRINLNEGAKMTNFITTGRVSKSQGPFRLKPTTRPIGCRYSKGIYVPLHTGFVHPC